MSDPLDEAQDQLDDRFPVYLTRLREGRLVEDASLWLGYDVRASAHGGYDVRVAPRLLSLSQGFGADPAALTSYLIYAAEARQFLERGLPSEDPALRTPRRVWGIGELP